MKFREEFQYLRQIDKRKWILVVVLVAVTHLFCQTLMLPCGNALHSLLSESKILLPENISLSIRESSVVKSANVGDSLSNFDNANVLIDRVKSADKGDAGGDGENNERVNEQRNQSHYPRLYQLNDNLFDEVVYVDEETTMQNSGNRIRGSVLQKNDESRLDLSLEQVTRHWLP
ncbi:hypothetical protein K7X08_015411 [Anisodus acutangulus]|uniref:Uncharacterized protein n=1 Tax=Anisodus acutangulus TaxID=402998 RepID=A0A9Q1L429_9SOLA|nr:hypothetical protein K7X08_015411 [Anisodus acutangulus]